MTQTYDLTIKFAGIDFRTLRDIEDKKQMVVDEWDVDRMQKTGRKMNATKHYVKERVPMTAEEIIGAIVLKTSYPGNLRRFVWEFITDVNLDEATRYSPTMSFDEFVMLLTKLREPNSGQVIAKINEVQPESQKTNPSLPGLW